VYDIWNVIGRPRLLVAAQPALQIAKPAQHVGLAEAIALLLVEGAGLVIGRPRLLVAAQPALQIAKPGQHAGLAEAIAGMKFWSSQPGTISGIRFWAVVAEEPADSPMICSLPSRAIISALIFNPLVWTTGGCGHFVNVTNGRKAWINCESIDQHLVEYW
jgi:hypothetical protein